MCIQNLKFAALPVPIISQINRGYFKTSGSPYIPLRSLFSKILMAFCSDGPCECIRATFEVSGLPVPEIDWSFGLVIIM